MRHKTEIDMEVANLTKVVRSEIRLKHALWADEFCYPGMDKAERTAIRRQASVLSDVEINNTLPDLVDQLWERVSSGELMTVRLDGEDGDRTFSLRVKRKLKILDFDCECRPMAFFGGDWVTKEITAIAWRFTHHGPKSTNHWLLHPSETWKSHQAKKREGLERFLRAYNDADVVTGHYIRGFDLPLVNAACIELGLPPLPAKYAHDTKGDLIRLGGISKSQENLAAHFDELIYPKVSMNTAKWEKGNSLVREGRKETKARVVGDVNQHVDFRQALMDRGALMHPQLWTSGAKVERYHA